MPISVRCPKCSSEYDVSEESIGRKMRCQCGTVFQPPADGLSLDDDEPAHRRTRGRPRRPAQPVAGRAVASYLLASRLLVWLGCLAWTGLMALYYVATKPENVIQQTALQGQAIACTVIGFAGAASLDRILAVLWYYKLPPGQPAAD